MLQLSERQRWTWEAHLREPDEGLNDPGFNQLISSLMNGVAASSRPFTPARVVYACGHHTQRAGYRPLDALCSWQSSHNNLHRNICDVSSDGLFLWWSANTLHNGRGSLLLYRTHGRRTSGSWAEWVRSRSEPSGWRLSSVVGAEPWEVECWLQRGTA